MLIRVKAFFSTLCAILVAAAIIWLVASVYQTGAAPGQSVLCLQKCAMPRT
jgi:hypothetical protein